MSNVKKTSNKQIRVFKLLFVFIIISGTVYFVVKSFVSSLFFTKADRINLLVYNKYPAVYSIGLRDNINYKLQFYPDIRVNVPGGYGFYRVGALGRLVNLEHKPELYSRTFSTLTNSFTTYFFYDKTDTVFYGGPPPENAASIPNALSFFTEQSNAVFLDRLYLAMHFFGKRNDSYAPLVIEEKMINKDSFALNEIFDRTYQGFFYQKILREEKKNIQLYYLNNYDSANRVSKMLEGNGIRVVDVSQSAKPKSDCQIIESSSAKGSYTGEVLSLFFHCPRITGPTTVSDIIFQLGNREGDWE